MSRETCKCIDDCGHRSAPAVTDNAGLREAPWRVGNHYGIHVYEGDRPVATFHREEDARRCVQALAERDDLAAEVVRLTRERDDARSAGAAYRRMALGGQP